MEDKTSPTKSNEKIIVNIDVTTIRRLIAVGSISVLLLVIAIIVGAKGPQVYQSQTYNLYQCQNDSHIYNPDTCSGPTMAGPWTGDMPYVTSLSRFWSLQMTPYSNGLNDTLVETVAIQVTVEGGATNSWVVISNETVYPTFACGSGYDVCNTITLIDEDKLDYNYYIVTITLLNGTSMIGDVDFTNWQGTDSFSSFEIGTHLTLMIISCVAIFCFLIAMRHYSLLNWSFEQKFLFILMATLILSNNPLYGLQYINDGWFFPFLNAFFAVIFLSSFALYSLMILDRIRLSERQFSWTKSNLVKVVVMAIFTLLGLILFTWLNIRDRKDPVVGPAGSDSGIEALFYLVATVLIGILLWILLMIIITIPVAYANQVVFTKFLFIAGPIFVYIVSIISGIFAGTFGPLNPTSLSVCYFNVLNNVFVAVIAYSYWPSSNPIRNQSLQQGLSEEDRLI